MEVELPGGFWVVAVLAVGYIIWYLDKQKRRKENISSAAGDLGMEYQEKDEGGRLLASFANLDFFTRGTSRKIYNILSGTVDGTRCYLVDYEFDNGGEDSDYDRQTVVVFYDKKFNLPKFRLRPENLMDKLGGLVGFADIDFKSHPEFSRKYHLSGTREGHVRKLFSKEALDYLSEDHGWFVEGSGRRLAICRRDTKIPVDRMSEFLDDAVDIKRVIIG